ncbi:MAG: hypothetical protein JXR20_05775 [Balneola sp.]
MANLVVKTLEYKGDKFHYKTPELTNGINILAGGNKGGKTTFMDLLYFGLSGNPKEFKINEKERHVQITDDQNNYVKIALEIDGKKYTFKRNISSNEITIYDEDGSIKTLPVNRGPKTNYIFSDWFLEKLGIDVIEIYQGHKNWKLGFLDILRLIYHNQELDPKKIYKSPEASNFVSDSILIRKIIFQVLVGKNYLKYYKSISEYKRLEKEQTRIKSLLDSRLEKSKNLRGNKTGSNTIHLEEELHAYVDQLDKLNRARSGLKSNRPSDTSNLGKVEELKTQFLDYEIRLRKTETKINSESQEIFSFRQLQENLIREVTQIQKIIRTHEELELFSQDTCPYCLRDVKRNHGECVCGQTIEEEQYEKFFYSSDEYLEILKSKKKSVETVNDAISGTMINLNDLEKEVRLIKADKDKIEGKIKELVSKIDGQIDVESLNDIDDKILEIRDEIRELNNQIDVSKEVDKTQKDLDAINDKLQSQKRRMDSLELSAEEDISNKISRFNKKYKELMLKSHPELIAAKIDEETFMPILNNGEYNAASVSVPVRLNYFLTLLSLSLNDSEVKFPRFLMIDTPQTAGIDIEELKNCINQFTNAVDIEEDNFQIILTTKKETLPEGFHDLIFDEVDKHNRLLNKVNKES